ncbi:MAG TPA: PAS domain-containing sensor histidine kinase [Chloroflexi bacterium]|nr:PAS domain-containing sensor histidine kinase [Chloroflexota bacterium]HBY06654.1 PAS domain-containing sensor histidine kinase [Chloroflexota bacterium]
MFRSIRWRIAIPYISLTLLIMLILGITVSYFVRQAQLSDLEESLTAQARLISDTLSLEIEQGLVTSAELDALAKHWSELLNARITLIDLDGVVVGESHEDRAVMDNHINRPEVQEALHDGLGVRIRRSPTLGYELMYVAVPVEANGELQGVARVALPLERVDANISQLERTIFGVTILAMVLTTILSIFIANRTTRPLLELTETALKMTEGRTPPPAPSPSYDEVAQLSHAFHALVNQLRRQIHALESEQGKLAAVLTEMTDGVIIADNQGHVEMINPAAANLFEIEISDAQGHSLAEVLRQHQLVELWQQCQQSGDEQAIMIELLHQQRFIQSIVISLGEALPGNYLLLFQDLTRMRRLETIRRDFISNVSHELRTPLASIKALTQTLQDGALDDPPAAQRFLERMDTEVDALTQMVSELLELTRIESGQVPLEFDPTAPQNLIEAAVERLGVQAERAGLRLHTAYPERLPEIFADATRLGQALVNLLHNAIKFTPEGGEVTISARQNGGVVEFSVKDTGIGIPANDLPRIFERFYKADRARSGGGTGLGLAIARHLVEAHGGRIWVESIEGRGSTFYFTIPIVM